MTIHSVNHAIARIERFTDRWWYLPLIGFLAFLDYFIAVIPTDGLLISSVMLRPKNWVRAAVLVTLGSAIGSWAIAAVVQIWGTGAIDWILGEGALSSPAWSSSRANLELYGVWAIFLMAMGPLPLVPFSILAGLGGMSLSKILVASLVGRGIKYVLFAGVAARAPHLLRKWFKRPGREAIEILEERAKN